eukprot:UN26610
MSKTGKHGHAKFTFNLKYPFTSQTSQEMWPGHTHLTRPIVKKYEWQLMEIDGNNITCLNEDDKEESLRFDFDKYEESGDDTLKTDLQKAWERLENDGDCDVLLTVLEGPIKDKKKPYYIRQITEIKIKVDDD